MTLGCPVCDSMDVQLIYPEHEGICITSDMKVLSHAKIDNRLCGACGLIFNAAGTRNFTEEFYRDSYSLMMHDEKSSIQSFSGPVAMSQAERTFRILREITDIPSGGSIIEVGAGKGEFLTFFNADFPEWDIIGLEPSNSFRVLSERLPNAKVYQCGYGTFDQSEGGADLIVALGVLEHVKNPLDMLRWANRHLRPQGLFYIRVPNFEKNPNDLFCVDHLSKLTVPTLRMLAFAAGFEEISVKEAGVPVFHLLRKTHSPKRLADNVIHANEIIVGTNVGLARRIMNSIIEAHASARRKQERFAIFGLASAGLFAPFFAGFDPDDIAAYIDENKTMWCSRVHDRKIGGLDLITSLDIRHIALAISPVYFDQVQRKLEPLNVSVYHA